MPLVSIVVPVYKVEKYLHRCVDSLLAQTMKDIEIILVDDGSPDNCGKICDEYGKQDDRIKVIHQMNSGVASARNVGIYAAQSKYVAFVDADDWVKDEIYADLYSKITSTNADLVFYDFYLVDESGKIFSDSFQSVDMPEMSVSAETALKLLFQQKLESFSSVFLCKRSLFYDNGIVFPEGRKYEDTATVYRLIAACGKIAFVREKLYYYYQRRQSITHSPGINDSRDAFLTLNEMEQYVSRFCPDVYPYFLRYQVSMLAWCYILYCKTTSFSKGQDDENPMGHQIRKKFYEQFKKVKLCSFTGSPYLLKIILMKLGLIRPLLLLMNKLKKA